MQTTALAATIAFVRKYKLLHITFWIWSFISLVHLFEERHAADAHMYWDISSVILFQILCVYFVVYWLMPKVLNKKKHVQFILLVIASIVVAALAGIFLQDLVMIYFKGRHLRLSSAILMFISHCTDLIVLTAIFFAIYTVRDRYYAEQQTNKLEKEKLMTELNFLKSQLNPHFLFNAINSIYVLIEEDKKLASQTLLKFSGLLRYQLYDCSNDWMPLERELNFLEDYIDLEKMRSEDSLRVSFLAECDKNNAEIAPFILTPFVENAFKHKSSYRDQNYVDIRLTLKDTRLTFSVANTYVEFSEQTQEEVSGGIGLQNVYRRLELLYPGKHSIEITKKEGVYFINLELELHENAMYFSRR